MSSSKPEIEADVSAKEAGPSFTRSRSDTTRSFNTPCPSSVALTVLHMADFCLDVQWAVSAGVALGGGGVAATARRHHHDVNATTTNASAAMAPKAAMGAMLLALSTTDTS